MRHFNIRKNQYFQPIINLDKLWSLVGNEVHLPVSSALFISQHAGQKAGQPRAAAAERGCAQGVAEHCCNWGAIICARPWILDAMHAECCLLITSPSHDPEQWEAMARHA